MVSRAQSGIRKLLVHESRADRRLLHASLSAHTSRVLPANDPAHACTVHTANTAVFGESTALLRKRLDEYSFQIMTFKSPVAVRVPLLEEMQAAIENSFNNVSSSVFNLIFDVHGSRMFDHRTSHSAIPLSNYRSAQV